LLQSSDTASISQVKFPICIKSYFLRSFVFHYQATTVCKFSPIYDRNLRRNTCLQDWPHERPFPPCISYFHLGEEKIFEHKKVIFSSVCEPTNNCLLSVSCMHHKEREKEVFIIQNWILLLSPL